MMEILDSGCRREFKTGAVRDIQEGKGRFDLVPLKELSTLFSANQRDILMSIGDFCSTGEVSYLTQAMTRFCQYKNMRDGSTLVDTVLGVALHYEQGCRKYGERNWEKGIDLHCFIDSGVRHLIKYFGGWDDEPHDRAFMWNMLGAMWTANNKKELCDIPTLYNTENSKEAK